jgi:hypothetical protein
MTVREDDKRKVSIVVESTIAKEPLRPGDHVTADGEFVWRYSSDGYDAPRRDKTAVGIVDPILRRAVQTGEKFWLLVYPRRIR